jgi:LPXTG-site transpeptidase (sortase) family protein
MTLRVRTSARTRTIAHLFSTVLVGGGLLCVSAYLWMCADGFVYQSVQQHYFPDTPPTVVADGPPVVAPVLEILSRQPERPYRWTSWIQPDPAVIGRLEIPRLNMNVMVREGTDATTLRRAVGHMPSTALPGRMGNFVITGHRDTFFRPLRGISRGDEIRAVTRSHIYRYRVYGLSVVSADDVEVLKGTNRPECTLVTCFPFDYVGPAPRRLIVQANLIE